MSNKTRYVLLGLLQEQPLTGYEMKQLIDIRFRFFWNESFGQIYPELKHMEEDDLVSVSQTGGLRKQKRYAITETGRRELKLWLASPNEKESIRIELLLKVYFSKYGSAEILASQIKQFQESHKIDYSILKAFEEELHSIPDPEGNHQDILRVIEFGVKTNEAYLSWCENTIAYLEGKR